MKGRRAARRAQLAEAMADVKCTACGRIFEGGTAAFQVHRDRGECLPGDAMGQLVQLRDGTFTVWWRLAGRATRP